MVTALLATPFARRTTSTVPLIPCGTCTFTWYSPTKPCSTTTLGASPAKLTGASIPFIVTVTDDVTRESG